MNTPLRLVLIEEADADAEPLLRALREGGFQTTCERVTTPVALRRTLREQEWDLVLSAYALRRLDAFAALRILSETGLDLPFIVVADSLDEDAAVAAMKAGAHDYVTKQKLARLVPAIRRELREAESRCVRRRAEEGLRETNQTLRALVQACPLAILAIDLDGAVQTWNPAAERMFGWEGDIAGQPCPLFVNQPDLLAELRDLVLRGEVVTGREVRCRRADGGPLDASVALAPLRGLQFNVTGMMAVVADITERKQTEEALLLRERTLEASSQGIVITDPTQPDNPIVYANPAFEQLTGYTVDEVIGRNCRFLQGPDTDPAAVAEFRAAVRDERTVLVEILNYRKEGTPFWNEVSVSPARDADGRVTHFVGILSNVTQRRRLEEQFRQAQKMEAVGRLAGGIAHDFNNLLTAILGYSELMLLTAAPGSELHEALDEIRKAGERAAGLTRQLLVFSRRQVTAPAVLSLNAVVEDMEKMLRRLIGEDVELAAALDPDLLTVRADPGQIEQVLLNLVVNARDAMPRGGKLTIETCNFELDETYTRGHPGVKPGQYVLLAVCDTGCGITEEVKAHLFEPFFTTKEKGKGTGLGLATVYGIVKQAEGHIAVYSEPGQGATFKVYLPAVAEPVEAARGRARLVPLPRGHETVLLVEDEDTLRPLIETILTRSGYTVLTAQSGTEALKVCARHRNPIHLLITDVVMPQMNGRELAERLTTLRPELLVLYVSGYTDEAVFRHGVLETGAVYLQKPFTPEGLTRKVREVLEGTAPEEPPMPEKLGKS